MIMKTITITILAKSVTLKKGFVGLNLCYKSLSLSWKFYFWGRSVYYIVVRYFCTAYVSIPFLACLVCCEWNGLYDGGLCIRVNLTVFQNKQNYFLLEIKGLNNIYHVFCIQSDILQHKRPNNYEKLDNC